MNQEPDSAPQFGPQPPGQGFGVPQSDAPGHPGPLGQQPQPGQPPQYGHQPQPGQPPQYGHQPPPGGPPQGPPRFGPPPGQYGPGIPGGPGAPGGPGFPPPPPPGSGPDKKILAIIGGAFGLVLVAGLVFALASGGDDDPIAQPPPAPSFSAPPGLADPSAPASPAATGPYTKVASPCGWVSKDTIAKLVPFTESHSNASKDGAGEDHAFTSCTWSSKYQRGAAKQISRELKVLMRLRTSSQHRDAVAEATKDMEYELGNAKENENKTDDFGAEHGAVTVPQIGDEAFTASRLSKKVRYGETWFRVGNYTVQVTYKGYDHPTKNFLDDSKDVPLPEDAARQGAEEVAAQVAEGIKGCTDQCTGAPAAPQTGPEDAPVQEARPSWANGVLKGLVDPCALVKPETLTRLIPTAGMQRIAEQGYTSGKDQSTATCIWSSDNSPDVPMRKIEVRLWYRTDVDKAKQTFRLEKERVEKQANKTDAIGIQYGPLESLTGVGDDAFVQSAVTTTPLGQALLTARVGNVVVDVKFSGGDGVNPMVPISADTAVAEAKAVTQDVLSILRP